MPESSRRERDTVVVIPTYNEAQNIVQLIRDLLDLPVPLDVIVVDDNSPDGTGALADAEAARFPGRVAVLHRAGKLGLGTAHIAGWRRALDAGYTGIMTMDADYSHHPRFVPAIVAAGETYDLVIGSRYVPGGGVGERTLYRRLISYGANWLAHTMLGAVARDLTGSFRLYRRVVLESLPLDEIRSNGYSFPIETAWLIERMGWHVGEVPIYFENRTRGASKVSRREILNALGTLLRLAGRRALRRGPKARANDPGT
jgi:dolichol-phosphate mannosyltransferase